MFLTIEKAYAIIKGITPPFLFRLVSKGPLFNLIKKGTRFTLKQKYTPSWNKISSGILAGVELYVDPKGDWQKEMLSGEYDNFFTSYLDTVDMNGKTVYDIGAHIGYSALFFATKVGPAGHVVTFEPNPFNVERIKLILSKNPSLTSRIQLVEAAVSNKNGEDNFIFSSYIDNGTSSGSFIDSAHTIHSKEGYINEGGFKSIRVKTIALDKPPINFKISADPDIVKLDIEGAEFLALQGMMETIKRSKPLILVEIHSIYNMYIAGKIFNDLNYSIELLKEEDDGRCFFAAKYNG